MVRNPRNADVISNSGRMLTDSVRGLHASHSKKKDVRNVEKKQQFKSEKKVCDIKFRRIVKRYFNTLYNSYFLFLFLIVNQVSV